MMVCPNCGSESEDDSVFCEQCGYHIGKKVENTNNQSKQPNPPSQSKKIRFVRQKK